MMIFHEFLAEIKYYNIDYSLERRITCSSCFERYPPSFYLRYTPEEQKKIREEDDKKIQELLEKMDEIKIESRHAK
jgi:hypothetical protein